MRTVVISSDARKTGKTLLAESLAARLSSSGLAVSCIKLSRGGHGPDSVTSRPGPPGSDTHRFSKAGCENILFFKYTELDQLREFMGTLSLDSHFLLLESNSVLEIMEPDFHIHISSPGDAKPSATGLAARADLVTDGPLDRSRAERLAGLIPALMGMGSASSI